jgi:DNA-binding response OmpR family regulator
MDRVLVVEADETLRETIEMILEEEGIAVVGASDIATALTILRMVDVPWVVLLDEWGMRPADLRTRLPDHAFVLMSTCLERESPLIDPVTGQAFPVLRLPFTIDELIDSVRNAAVRVSRARCEVHER